MNWTLLIGIVLVVGLSLFATVARRHELARMQTAVRERALAVQRGSAEAQLQHPVIDLSRCLGCGTCVDVCPEDGVLELVHGQAMVVNGARCVGVSACERECPVDAITVTLSNVKQRDDIPAITEGLEAIGSPGLFLAGEVTAQALIKTAVEHGTAVAEEVARRTAECHADDQVLDLCVVGAGPAGLACSLEARRHDLSFVVLDQEHAVGGTVAKYPRRKLVLTQPVDLPLHGRLDKRSFTKEELIDTWRAVADEHELPVHGGQVFTGVERLADGTFEVRTETDTFHARHVCLAVGRRGVPRRLGVPGEDLPNVTYALMDATSFAGRRVLVVGGGDSAVEAALALSEQDGTEVTVSYRKDGFFRAKVDFVRRLEERARDGRVKLFFDTEVRSIAADSVTLARVSDPDRVATVPVDDVFVFAGGTPPFEMLQQSGVSFDPSLREESEPLLEQGTGLTAALAIGLVLALATLGWALWHADYYTLPESRRVLHERHELLRSGLGLGLWLGITATALIVVNLLYLLRRSPGNGFQWGSLSVWMTSHVATGIVALLLALLHAGFAPQESSGGHAFWALAILLVSGAIGRYFYAYVPRAANGRELRLNEVKERLRRESESWDADQRAFRARARSAVMELIEAKQWRSSFVGRVLAITGLRRGLQRTLSQLSAEARDQGVDEAHISETVRLARSAHWSALMVAHYEDLRAVLNTWRYVHRWVALLMVVLLVVHIVHALSYGAVLSGRGIG